MQAVTVGITYNFQDVITSGSSVIETAAILRKEGLRVQEVVVFLDRQQGGKLNLEKNDINVHSVVTVNQLFDILLEAGKVSYQHLISCAVISQSCLSPC